MNTAIFNRTGGAAAPAPGARQWARIETQGEHPAVLRGADGTPEPVVQVLDGEAFAAMVEDFRNRREAAGAGWGGMLVDLDHLSHDPAHDTQAQAWLHDLRIEGGHLMGLLEGLQAAAMLRPRPMESPNASVETDLAGLPRSFRDRLAERMRGLAEWDGDTLRMTDPNGTRPYTAEALAQVWSRPLPERFHDLPGQGQMQREALRQWASDHDDFERANGTDRWEDLLRVWQRLPAPDEPAELWRGMAMDDARLQGFLRGLDGKQYSTRKEYPLESWTDSLRAARRYAATGGPGWSVVLRVRGARRAKDISALVRALRESISKKGPPPVETESEWAYRTGEKFKVRSVRKDGESRTVEIELEEVSP